MKRWLSGGVLVGVSTFVCAAAAETPPARVGFQMAMRTGFAVPAGEFRKDRKMSDAFAGQLPFLVDVGGKVIPQLFLGGYLGINFGGTAGTFKSLCDGFGATCLTATFRLGIELAYQIVPDGPVDPWIGYGVGLESTALSGSQGTDRIDVSFTGWEVAHLMAGVDFRVSRGFGVGPFFDFSTGTYTRQHIEATGETTIDSDIPDTASHQWLTFGARFVLFP